MNESDNQWHLDKRVPVAIIVTLLIYGGSLIWTLATNNSKNVEQDRRISDIEQLIGKGHDEIKKIGEGLIRLDVQLSNLNSTVGNLGRIIEQHKDNTKTIEILAEEIKDELKRHSEE